MLASRRTLLPRTTEYWLLNTDDCQTKHPRFDFTYPLDYGYLKDTASMDGNGIDVWRGSLSEAVCNAVVCTVDLVKRDSEIKILIGCTAEEKSIIMRFHNESEYMKGTMTERKT